MSQTKSKLQISPWVLQGLLVLACIILAYHQTIQGLIAQWAEDGNFSHGLFIFPLSAYIVWERRHQLKSVPVETDWRALPFIVFTGIVYILGELGAELFTTRVSMILLTIGSVWLLFGFQLVKAIRFPLLYLFVMLPLPGLIYRNLTFPLQIFSSELAVRFLRLIGVSAVRDGNVIDLGFSQLQVVEACSGLRYLLPFFAVGVFLSFYDKKTFWERVILILITIPIALAANIVRISGTGIMTNTWGPEAADGFLHSFSGWAVFMFCAAVFVAFSWALHRVAKRTKGHRVEEPKASSEATPRRRVSWKGVAATVLFVICLPGIVRYFSEVRPVELKQSLSIFPMVLDGWKGMPAEMTPEMWDQVGGQEYVLIDYRKPDEPTVNFYSAYYTHQRKAGDFIHSPKLCLPGAGWYVKQSVERRLNDGTIIDNQPVPLRFNEMLVEKDGNRQLVYYWYQGRDRNFTNEYVAKFYMVWDGIFRRRTDGALVRLITPMAAAGSVEQAREVLDPFAIRVSTLLDEFLP